MIADYETLKLIWWGLVGVLLIGFALTDGFDMGVGVLLPFLGRNDEQRRVIINTVGPHWEGNQVWFVTAGGALFAAWPLVYASAFSGMYAALIITLMALFLRPVGLITARNRIQRAGAKTGIGRCSLAPLCRRSFLVWPSATCFWACLSPLMS